MNSHDFDSILFWVGGLSKSNSSLKKTWHFCVLFSIGCLQSVYGIHTFRVESITHGKAAPVDELQVQGVSNPGLLRKVN